MAYLLKPLKDTPFQNCLNALISNSDKEQFRLFVHFLIKSDLYQNDFIGKKYIEVGRKYITKYLFNNKNYLDVINTASTSGALSINHKYFPKEKCKGYKLNFYGKNIAHTYKYTFTSKVNSSKFNKLWKHDITPNDINSIKQIKFISELKLDLTELNGALKVLVIKRSKSKKKVNLQYLNHIEFLKNDCLNFSSLNSFSFYDNFGCRYYNFFSNKQSEIRKCFTIGGKTLRSWDISNSQIYFFTQLPNLDLSNYKVDKSKIIIEEKFKQLVLEGKIYQYLAKRIGEKDVQKAKIRLLSFFYGDNRIKKIKKILMNDFPLTFQTIDYLKNIVVNDNRFYYQKLSYGKIVYRNTYFNYLLQSVETDTFLGSFHHLDGFYTIHDSVYFKNGEEDLFKNAIKIHFTNLRLDLPHLK